MDIPDGDELINMDTTDLSIVDAGAIGLPVIVIKNKTGANTVGDLHQQPQTPEGFFAILKSMLGLGDNQQPAAAPPATGEEAAPATETDATDTAAPVDTAKRGAPMAAARLARLEKAIKDQQDLLDELKGEAKAASEDDEDEKEKVGKANLTDVQTKLAAAQTEIAKRDTRIGELETQVAKLTSDNAALAAAVPTSNAAVAPVVAAKAEQPTTAFPSIVKAIGERMGQ